MLYGWIIHPINLSPEDDNYRSVFWQEDEEYINLGDDDPIAVYSSTLSKKRVMKIR
jgi:NADH:ubiquinone oxidoreductase subunit